MLNQKSKQDLISVVIPIYKVADLLPKCVDSILAQSYRNLEIILVDDGSPDNSGEICEEYAKKDHRVKVVHKKNGGLSSARNAGIDIHTGKYILFVDSDDYINPKMIETLYQNLQTTGADISICDYVPFSDKKQVKNRYSEQKFVISGNEKYDYIAPSNKYSEYGTVSTVQWNKLFKSEIFKKLRYPEGKINEDEFIITNQFHLAKKISYILEPLYYYYQRPNSIIHSFSMNRLDIIDAFNLRIDFYRSQQLDQYILPIRKMKVIFLIDFVGNYYSVIKKDHKAKETLDSYIQQNASDAKELLRQDVSRKLKIKIRLLLHYPWLLCIAFRIMKQDASFIKDFDND